MSGVMGKFLVTGIVLSSIVACSSGSDDNKFKSPTAKATACEFKFTDGGNADYASLSQRNIVKTYFAKEYNASYLAAVSGANAESTMDFVNQTGTTLYKSEPLPRNLCGFSLFTSAKVMPLDIEAKWNSATKDDGPKKGYTLGVYLPKSSTNTIPTLNYGAAIVIRENTDRWTLVHEFMHHLFMLRAVENGHNDDTMKSSLDAYNDEMDAIDQNTQIKDDAQKALLKAPTFVKFANAVDSLMEHYSLEEITIEATLKDAVKAGTLRYVPTDGDNWYIFTNAVKAYGVYEQIDKMAKDITAKLPANAWSEQSAIRDVLTMTSRRKGMIIEMAELFPYEQPKSGAKMVASQHQHTGCSHEAEAQKVLDKAIEILNKH